MTDKKTGPDEQLKKANIRLALALGAVALGVMVYTMFTLLGRG